MRRAKFVSLSLSAALVAGLVGLTGCTTDNNVRTQNVRNNNGRNYDVNSLPQGNRMFTRSAGNGQAERIRTLKYSPALSNKVAGLKDVQTAHVVVTDRDAYVALTLHGNNIGTTTGTNGRVTGMSTGMGAGRGTTNFGGPYGANYGTRGAGDNGLAGNLAGGRSGVAGSLYDMARGGTGLTGRNTVTGTNRGMGLGGTTGLTGRNTVTGTNRGMGLDGTTGLTGRTVTGTNRGMGLGGVTGTGNIRGLGTTNGTMGTRTGTGTFNGVGNGTVAGTVTDNVPQHVKDEVSNIVKKTAPHIRNVYVSGNPDFVSQVGTYATQTRGGATLHGYIADFQRMIDRVFPSRNGTMTGPSGYAPTTNGTTGTTGINRTGVGTGGYSGGVTR
ncbi:YhcN/YlaJ family sporulation lipoprotein [Paenibacillus sp. M1]|uniref:YhcN/YlaJ family sporulation lipoprotein n=1 Tax=Paenibacillus haidiansis TaxID=1574488 RepID=A0ABU7VW16_9BACL